MDGQRRNVLSISFKMGLWVVRAYLGYKKASFCLHVLTARLKNTYLVNISQLNDRPLQTFMTIIMPSTFEPSEHLEYQPPSKIWTMEELDFPEDQGISPMSVSEPFRLFSESAVREMRKEILSRPVWENHRFQSKHAQCQLRGYARRYLDSRHIRSPRARLGCSSRY